VKTKEQLNNSLNTLIADLEKLKGKVPEIKDKELVMKKLDEINYYINLSLDEKRRKSVDDKLITTQEEVRLLAKMLGTMLPNEELELILSE